MVGEKFQILQKSQNTQITFIGLLQNVKTMVGEKFQNFCKKVKTRKSPSSDFCKMQNTVDDHLQNMRHMVMKNFKIFLFKSLHTARVCVYFKC